VTPSGKVGYVPDDAIGALDSDQLCFVKDASRLEDRRLRWRR